MGERRSTMLMLLALLACGPAVESDAVVLYEDGVEVLRCDGEANAGEYSVRVVCGEASWAHDFGGDDWMTVSGNTNWGGYGSGFHWDAADHRITGWAEGEAGTVYLLTFDVVAH